MGRLAVCVAFVRFNVGHNIDAQMTEHVLYIISNGTAQRQRP